MGENIVVVGAGVSGLTSALLLSRDKANKVTVVAKHMPGDYDIEYASPFAGANILPMATKEDSRWETVTWKEMKRLCEEVPEAGIHFQKCRLLRRDKDKENVLFPESLFDDDPWFRSLYDDYRDLPRDEVPPGFDSASEWTNLCINTAIYLPWLVGQLLRNGVVLRRAVLSHIRDAVTLSHTGSPATLVVNTTGLGARRLGGVEDAAMTPVRAQVVVVRNEVPMTVTSGTDGEPYDVLYAMTRAAGGGTILGGTYDVGNWDALPDPNVALRIMTRIVERMPEVAGGRGVAGLDVVRHAVGLRPYRQGGVRIERERLDDGTWVIHNYGHGGWGYQASWGCAEDVLALAKGIQRSAKAKL